MSHRLSFAADNQSSSQNRFLSPFSSLHPSFLPLFGAKGMRFLRTARPFCATAWHARRGTSAQEEERSREMEGISSRSGRFFYGATRPHVRHGDEEKESRGDLTVGEMFSCFENTVKIRRSSHRGIQSIHHCAQSNL